MRKTVLSLALVLLCIASASAQQSAAPQTARQALLEMFFGKTPGTFVKHLPAVTRAALEKSGAFANLQQYSVMVNQLHAQGTNIQTFDTGSVLLSTEDSKTSQKVEITVENDTLHGDEDDLELSFQIYKNGQPQPAPVKTQLTFSMKREDEIWKLNEISVTVHLPLADPEFLKIITEKMKPQITANTTLLPRSETAINPSGSDAMVLAAMRQILAAEVTYASNYPAVGFTCTLSDLDGFGGGQPNEHQAMLINSGLASGKRYGFIFTLSGCSGSPASGFHLIAAPNANTFGRKTFCADQSGMIRTSSSGDPATCMASGTPIQ